jgi:hypothetical protein
MPVVASIVVVLSGCAVSRQDQLRAESRRVGKHLTAERSRALAMLPTEPERTLKLDHLGDLRLSLSAANIALGAVPRFLPEQDHDLAYDVLEEVYATIDWNAPLLPGESGMRAFPEAFGNNTLNWSALTGGGQTPATRSSPLVPIGSGD